MNESTDQLANYYSRYIEVSSVGCWIWIRAKPGGYGPHRTIYEKLVGEIPKGLELDHLCRVKACVNPDHLDPVTHRENVRRSPISLAALNMRKTHCPYGHGYTTTTNIAGRNEGRVQRVCRTCQNLYTKQFTEGNPLWPPC
jgi:hypothetical protein